MNTLKSSAILVRIVSASALAVVLASTASAQHGGATRVGNPYVPPGSSGYKITAVQGIDDSHPLGQSNPNTQVNTDFEMRGTIGVTYDQGNGHLKDFGLGLYQGDHHGPVASTGLRVDYDGPVNANDAEVTLSDFDIHSLADGFKNGKVAPAMVILGAGGSIMGSMTPANFLSSMTSVGDDVWDVNVGRLMNAAGLQASQITGFVLHADAKHGEKANSDPYLLKSVKNAVPAPEPGTLCAVGAGLLYLRRRTKKAKA